MTNAKKNRQEKKDFVYADKAQTNILLELPSDNNPYVTKTAYLHGYDVLELMAKKSFVETLLLLFTGELPPPEKVKLLEQLMVGLMNPGPRHPAVKAAMVAGVSKANAEHLLPVGLTVLGGKSNGAKEVELAMIFLQENKEKLPEEVVSQLLKTSHQETVQGEFHLTPGFGNNYGSIDEFADGLAAQLFNAVNNSAEVIAWGKAFNETLKVHDMGWLKTGIAAAVFCELDLSPRQGNGFFQLLCAPGILAHGVEQTHKPITAIPMLSDEQHVYTPEGDVNEVKAHS
ncbi:hypothetical protein [Thalassomonas actiniarum]|uniref:Citrate synthase n=1 Tax=Thalassomonas actiniarum TaxID=485447 RepID=A0AAF0C5N8_9GAMM|nr:hypothetical protein [Thalassomonas actiniarum]WDE01169.1 citrate synthase [Thalassomonas actiniarum]